MATAFTHTDPISQETDKEMLMLLMLLMAGCERNRRFGNRSASSRRPPSAPPCLDAPPTNSSSALGSNRTQARDISGLAKTRRGRGCAVHLWSVGAASPSHRSRQTWDSQRSRVRTCVVPDQMGGARWRRSCCVRTGARPRLASDQRGMLTPLR